MSHLTDTLPHFGTDTPVDALVGALRAEGCAVLHGACKPGQADAIVRELAPLIAATPFGEDDDLGLRTKCACNLLPHSAGVRELAVHPLVNAAIGELLAPVAARFQLNFGGFMHIEPGETPQVPHRDTFIYPFRSPAPTITVSTMWALTDFTAENGATRVAPRSHRWDEAREVVESELIPAEMPQGAVLLYDGGLIHGGGGNASRDAVRTGLALQYTAGWLRQEENMALSIPREVVRTFSEPLQRLIGYDFGGANLGFVNLDDPHKLLEDDPDPRVRCSTDELNDAMDRMGRFRFGDIEPGD